MSDVAERLRRFLEVFTERVPVEFAALIHVPTGTIETFTLSPAVNREYFESNIERFVNLVETSEALAIPEVLGELQGSVLRGSNGYEIIAKISENVILVCGSSDTSSLGIALLKVVELKDLIRRRSGRSLRG